MSPDPWRLLGQRDGIVVAVCTLSPIYGYRTRFTRQVIAWLGELYPEEGLTWTEEDEGAPSDFEATPANDYGLRGALRERVDTLIKHDWAVLDKIRWDVAHARTSDGQYVFPELANAPLPVMAAHPLNYPVGVDRTMT